MNDNPLLVDEDAGVVTLTLNRPEVLNAMSLDMWNELHRAVQDLTNDHTVKVLVLRGAGGRSFSAGMDIKSEYETFSSSIDTIGKTIHGCCRDIMTLPQVAVCVIEGYCFGGALEGRETSRPFSLIKEVVTMKKINMMNTMSSIGVMLISASSSP